MKWLQPRVFKRKFRDKYHDAKVYIEPCFNIEIELKDLEQAIPMIAEFYAGGIEEPAPCKRWYGLTKDVLFAVVVYIGNHRTVATFHSPRQSSDRYPWTILNKFTELPSTMLRRITWIRGNDLNATVSLFCENNDGIVQEVYRAKNETEANELLIFLSNIESAYQYYLGVPEEAESTWIIVRTKSGSSKTVARYTSRVNTEYTAKSMSTNDDAIYAVFDETKTEPIVVFSGGAKILT